jgi:biotin transport system substrate-specific component
MILYLVVGATGLPVFAPVGAPGLARFAGPTGGYLIAYPAAAFVAGALGRRATSLTGRWVAAVVGIAVIFVGGIAQLTILTGSFRRAVQLGITPFAALDILKAWVAAAISGTRTARRSP